MKTSLLTLVTLAGLIVAQSQANVGWTLQECIQHYGKEVSEAVEHKSEMVYHFHFGNLNLYAFIPRDGPSVTEMEYRKIDHTEFSESDITHLLKENGGDVNWIPHIDEYGLANWIGQKYGKTVLTASYDLLDGGLGYALMITVEDSEQ